MSTGYDAGSGSSYDLTCRENYFYPPPNDPVSPCLSDGQVNYMSTNGATSYLQSTDSWAGATICRMPFPYPAAGNLAWGEEFSFECWVHPRINIPTANYGTDVPFGAGGYGGLNSCNTPVTWESGFHHYFTEFRTGQGIGIGYRDTNAGVEWHSYTAFPADMERWFYFAIQVRTSASGPPYNMWIDGYVDGTPLTQITHASNAGLANYQTYFNSGTGVNFDGVTPTIGAVASHRRRMTANEMATSLRNGTVNGLAETGVAADFKQITFCNGPTCAMPAAIFGASQIVADANLGNGVLDGISTVTCYGTNYSGDGIGCLRRQLVPDLQLRYPAYLNIFGDENCRFGWFNGR